MESLDVLVGISSIASILASNLSDDELSFASVFFTQLGDSLATASVTRDIRSKVNTDSSNNNKDITTGE